MPKTSFYYTLLVREGHRSTNSDRRWTIEFGDYDRVTVLDERSDWLDHYDDDGHKRLKNNTLVISTGDKAKDIQARVDELNAALK